jgi:hypothetical protein
VDLDIPTTPTDPPLIPTSRELAVEAISDEEIRQAQATDPDCQHFLTATARAGLYDLNEECIVIRTAPSDGAWQVFVPRSIVSWIFNIEH